MCFTCPVFDREEDGYKAKCESLEKEGKWTLCYSQELPPLRKILYVVSEKGGRQFATLFVQQLLSNASCSQSLVFCSKCAFKS